MKTARLSGGVVALCAFVAVVIVYARMPARSFDLQDSPATVSRPAADITDTYLFPSPSNPNNVVAVMDVYPLIPSSSNATTALNTFFDQQVLYTMKFDTNYADQASNGGRPIENVVLQISFGAPANGTQEVYAYGPLAPNGVGTSTSLVDSGTPTGTGFINKAFTLSSPYSSVHVFAGARRDPAFLNATSSATGSSTYPFLEVTATPGTYFGIFPGENPNTATAQSCITAGSCPAGFNHGTDLFGQTDVLSIVAEFPKNLIVGASGIVGYWATTATNSGH